MGSAADYDGLADALPDASLEELNSVRMRLLHSHVQTLTGQVAGLVVAQKSQRDSLEIMWTELQENTRATHEGVKTVESIRQTFEDYRSGFRVLGWLGGIIRWTGIIATTAGSVYAFIHMIKTGETPK